MTSNTTPTHSYQLAVVGNPIAHSLSPLIHNAFAKHCDASITYDKILAPLDGFDKVVQDFFAKNAHVAGTLGAGLNITVPFKQQAYKLCGSRLTERARAAGAVNTLYTADGKVFGDNTDGQGLVNALKSLSWCLHDARVAIIGAGGAARGVLLPLLRAGAAHITVANRTVAKAEQLVTDLGSLATLDPVLSYSSIEDLTGHFDIIINATSASLSGAALPFSNQLSTAHAYDMVYDKSGNPTPFMSHFGALGAGTSDGLGMLIGQAAVSFEIWTGHAPNVSAIDFSFLRQAA